MADLQADDINHFWPPLQINLKHPSALVQKKFKKAKNLSFFSKSDICKMDKCPRCNLPQKGIYKCQYCGYDLKKYNKRPVTIIRKRFKDSIIGIKQSRIFSSNKKSRVLSMNNAGRAFKIKDSRENRSGAERRKHQYATYYPERRSGIDRRK